MYFLFSSPKSFIYVQNVTIAKEQKIEIIWSSLRALRQILSRRHNDPAIEGTTLIAHYFRSSKHELNDNVTHREHHMRACDSWIYMYCMSSCQHKPSTGHTPHIRKPFLA